MKNRWKTAHSVLGIACTILSTAPGWAKPSDNGDSGFVPNELIVLLAPVHLGAPPPEEVVERARRGEPLPANLGVGNPQRGELGVTHRAQGAARERLQANPDSPEARLERYIVLTYPSGTDLDRIKKVLLANPHVLHVQENRIFRFSVMPSDPLVQDRAFGVPLGPHEYQWGAHILNLPAAWDYAKGHSYIGVLDGGLAVSHEDLQTFSGSTFAGGNFRAHFSHDFGDADADVDEIQGTSEQGAGHGTHVSGIIAATANNGIGVAGTCWHCSLMMAKVLDDSKRYLIHEQDVVDAFRFVINNGAQVVNMSFGRPDDTSCAEDTRLSMFCTAIELAERRDLTLVAASGNSREHLQFPANDARFIAVGGVEPVQGPVLGAVFWDEEDSGGCPSVLCAVGDLDCECGSNYTVNFLRNPQTVVAPAADVLSTFYPGRTWNADVGCAANPSPNDKYGLCTGTSMSAPFVTGITGLLRSVNPLLTNNNIKNVLTSNADRAASWDAHYGYGIPNAAESVKDALGRAGGNVLPNRLTPLFSLYNFSAQDFFYTTAPQMATAALFDAVAPYSPSGPSVPGYLEYPGGECQVGPCLPTQPTASVYIFTTDRAFPGTLPLVPLYRMSNRSASSSLNWDTTYTTEAAGILRFRDFDGNGTVDHELDGIEGYIYQRCTPEPTCIPAGAVRLYRLYNASRKDWAIFPDFELPQMQAAGYAPVSGFNDWIGYVYRNEDSDGDSVINGFETLLGTNPSRSDSDCDGLSDGTEILAYPYDNKDPRGLPGCVPPVAKLTFSCSGLFCSFDASGSTDNVGIVSYSWTFGDSTSGSGVTTSHSYGATGSYTVTLTVTDGHGLQSFLSRKVSVTDEAPVAAEGFFTVPPCRIADTRSTTPLTSGVLRGFQVTGLCGIPATARAVSVNLTVVSPTGPGHLVFFPGTQSSGPFAHASINFDPPNSARANNGILRLGGAGSVNVFPAVQGTPGEVHLILDVYGYFSEDAGPAPGAQGPLGFQTVTPCRIGDTRTSGGPIAVNTTRNFTVQGVCGVPGGAAAAALNPVVLGPTAGGHATLFQAGAFPPVPTINFNAGVVLANGARSRLAATVPDISFNYFSPTAGASTHALIDVYGYFATGAPLRYRPITPCRAVDTRFDDQGAPALGAPGLRVFQIRGNCGVPATAKAVAVNLTTVGAAGPGHLVVYPSGGAAPAASYLNFDPSQGALGNGGIVALSNLPDDLAVASGNATHLIIDVFGYFE